MFGSWVQTENWIINLSSALIGRYINEFIQIIPFFERNSVQCYTYQACCFLYHLCEIITSFPLNFYISFSPDVVVVSDFNKNICELTISRKKGTDRRIYIPLFTPLR